MTRRVTGMWLFPGEIAWRSAIRDNGEEANPDCSGARR